MVSLVIKTTKNCEKDRKLGFQVLQEYFASYTAGELMNVGYAKDCDVKISMILGIKTYFYLVEQDSDAKVKSFVEAI